MIQIEDAIECFGDELPSMRVTEKDVLQAIPKGISFDDAQAKLVGLCEKLKQ